MSIPGWAPAGRSQPFQCPPMMDTTFLGHYLSAPSPFVKGTQLQPAWSWPQCWLRDPPAAGVSLICFPDLIPGMCGSFWVGCHELQLLGKGAISQYELVLQAPLNQPGHVTPVGAGGSIHPTADAPPLSLSTHIQHRFRYTGRSYPLPTAEGRRPLAYSAQSNLQNPQAIVLRSCRYSIPAKCKTWVGTACCRPQVRTKTWDSVCCAPRTEVTPRQQ